MHPELPFPEGLQHLLEKRDLPDRRAGERRVSSAADPVDQLPTDATDAAAKTNNPEPTTDPAGNVSPSDSEVERRRLQRRQTQCRTAADE